MKNLDRETREWLTFGFYMLCLFAGAFIALASLESCTKYATDKKEESHYTTIETTRLYQVVDMWISDDMSVAMKTKDSTGAWLEVDAVGAHQVYLHDDDTVLVVTGWIDIGSVHEGVKEKYLYVNRDEYMKYLERRERPEWLP